MTLRPVSHQLLALLGWLLLVSAAAAVGAIASLNASAFYIELSKPAWAAPAHVFGPVWSVLYLLMGVSAWLVWRSSRRNAVALFCFWRSWQPTPFGQRSSSLGIKGRLLRWKCWFYWPSLRRPCGHSGRLVGSPFYYCYRICFG
jgi:tryptophan-rich sensory protein